MQYDELKCDGSRNSWVYGSSSLTPTTKADKELNFECQARGMWNTKALKYSMRTLNPIQHATNHISKSDR